MKSMNNKKDALFSRILFILLICFVFVKNTVHCGKDKLWNSPQNEWGHPFSRLTYAAQ